MPSITASPRTLNCISLSTLPTLLVTLCFTSLLQADDSKPGVVEDGFVSLFDGKTLAGWEGDEKTFSVKDGVIVAGSPTERIPRNEFLCTKKLYGDFELRLQAKLVGDGRNAGVQFRSARIPDHHEVRGYQADIGVMGEDHSIWGALYDESRRRRFLVEGDQESLRKAVRADQWNDLVIRCEGAHVVIKVNGVVTVDYQEEEADIEQTGIIGLQIHGGAPAVASYRHIRIQELKPSAGR